MFFKKILLTNLSLFPISVTTLFVISCSEKSKSKSDFDYSQNIHHQWLDQNPAYFSYQKSLVGKHRILADSFYNQLLTSSEFDRNKAVEIVIIANQKVYTEIVPVNDASTLEDILNNMYWLQIRQKYTGPWLGKWIATFKVRNQDNSWTDWLHGEGTGQTYDDFYPLFWINRRFSNFGVTNWNIEAGDIYEISYDIDL